MNKVLAFLLYYVEYRVIFDRDIARVINVYRDYAVPRAFFSF